MTTRLLLLLPIALLSGCASMLGTFAQSGPDKVFIGTRTDAQLIAKGCPDASPCLLPRPIAALDLPLSAVMDTLFLVYTVPYTASRSP